MLWLTLYAVALYLWAHWPPATKPPEGPKARTWQDTFTDDTRR